MPTLVCQISQSLQKALEKSSKETGEPICHLVTKTLSQCMGLSLHTLFQVSTSGALVQGVYERAVSTNLLLRHGDFGLGTFEHLDGEMVVLDGAIYQIRSDGTVTKIVEDVGTPFAVVVAFVPNQDKQIVNANSFRDLTEYCDHYRGSNNLFYAFRVDGHFRHIRTRAMRATTSGLPLPKAEAIQPEFDFNDIDGTLVGIWAPQFSSAVNIAGYHFHFLSVDRTKGGHLLECSGSNLRIRLETLDDFHLSLPESEEFLRADLSKDTLKILLTQNKCTKKENHQMPVKTDEKKPKNGADIVVQTLEQRGVEYVFGVPGAKIDKVFDTLVDSKIRTVVCRHEQNAAFIAGGIGRMTGKAGIAIATSGPGVSNLVTGLATANTEGDPVIALGGAVALADRLKKVHQTMDSVSLCRPVTKYSAEVDSPESVSEILTNAFRTAESGRPGAAFVSLPMDIMLAPAKCDVLTTPAYSGVGPADSAAIKEAARLINQAKRPVVLLGLLASRPQSAAAVHEFIETGQLPVVGTFQAAGAVSMNLFSNFGGRVGQINNQPADAILAVGDLVISIGYDPVEYWPSIWNKGNKRPIVHLDALPADIDNSYSPVVELTGDIASTLRLLSPLISHRAPEPPIKRLLEKIVKDREELTRSSAALSGTPVHPLRLVAELQKILTPDVTLCLDMGSFHLWMARHLYSFQARQILMTNGQQTLGVALPWAIAATLVRPAEKVLSISGDGGFLFSSMELETAVRLQSHFVHMIWIDGSYDMVAEQEVLKYGRPSGTDLGPLDPVKYAEAFGAKGFMIQSSDQISTVLKRAFDTPGPVLVGVHVDYRDNRKLFEQIDERSIH